MLYIFSGLPNADEYFAISYVNEFLDHIKLNYLLKALMPVTHLKYIPN